MAWQDGYVQTRGEPPKTPPSFPFELRAQAAVTLSDFRGKVVVIVFWSTNDRIEEDFATIRYLAEIQTRFKTQPLAILALHDASADSPDRLKKALETMGNEAGQRSIRILLDLPPIGTKNGRDAGEVESGRTADLYENWATRTEFVIDKSGTLVSVIKAHQFFVDKDHKLSTEVAFNSLVWALEDQFGLPRSPAQEPEVPGFVPALRTELTVITGKVADLEGKPIVGATVTDGLLDSPRDPAVKSGPNGEFTIRAKKPAWYFHLSVEASGFAPRDFKMFVGDDHNTADFQYSSIDRSGVIRRSLQLGLGVEVKGRVLKDGKPGAGVVIGLKHSKFESDLTPLRRRETRTDADGYFHFSHVLAETDFWVYTKLASFDDGSTLIPGRVRTTGDGSAIDAGELLIGAGRSLAGRLVCSDGKPVPDDLELIVLAGNVAGDMKQQPGPEGRFKFTGLPAGPVSLCINFRNRPFLGPGPYRFSAKNRCLNPEIPVEIEGRLDHDITDLTLLLEPGAQDMRLSRDELDPAVIADFNDAKAGPITGVEPK